MQSEGPEPDLQLVEPQQDVSLVAHDWNWPGAEMEVSSSTSQDITLGQRIIIAFRGPRL